MTVLLKDKAGTEIIHILCWDRCRNIVSGVAHDQRCGNQNGFRVDEFTADELYTGETGRTLGETLEHWAAVIIHEDTTLARVAD